MITEVEPSSLQYFSETDDVLINRIFGEKRDFEVVLTNSGKAAVAIILSYYKSTGRIKNKNDELWVPQWIGAWVYNIIQKVCFPSITPSERTRGILVYHQYGFPQKFEKLKTLADQNQWFVIEDCAHAIESYDGGFRLGLRGDAGIFSFSKFFPSVMGGALVTRDPKLAEFARNKIASTSLNQTLVSTIAFYSKWALGTGRFPWMKRFLNLWVEMTYAVYDEIPKMFSSAQRIVNHCLQHQSLAARNANRDYFLRELAHTKVFDRFHLKEITPYVLPLILEESVLKRIASAFHGLGVSAGLYHFDLNQDMSAPHFVKCLWIPVHPGVSETLRASMVAAIKKEIL